jgi:hypothetical protein
VRQAKLADGAAMCAAQSRASLGPNRVKTGTPDNFHIESAIHS